MFKKSVVIKANKFKPKANMVNFKIDYKLIIFFTLFICGLILGMYISKHFSEEFLQFVSESVTNQIKTLQSGNFLQIFFKIFFPFLTIYILIYIIGLSGVGVPFLCIIPILLGCIISFKTHQYYIASGLSIAICCVISYLPLYAIATATFMKRCCHCFDISGEIFVFLITGKGEGKPLLKDYTLKHLFFIIPICIGAVISSVLFEISSKLFTI